MGIGISAEKFINLHCECKKFNTDSWIPETVDKIALWIGYWRNNCSKKEQDKTSVLWIKTISSSLKTATFEQVFPLSITRFTTKSIYEQKYSIPFNKSKLFIWERHNYFFLTKKNPIPIGIGFACLKKQPYLNIISTRRFLLLFSSVSFG